MLMLLRLTLITVLSNAWTDWEHVWAPQRIRLEMGKEQTLGVRRILEISLPSSDNQCNPDPSYSWPNVSVRTGAIHCYLSVVYPSVWLSPSAGSVSGSMTVPISRQCIRQYECPRLPVVYPSVWLSPSAGSVWVGMTVPVCRQCIRQYDCPHLSAVYPSVWLSPSAGSVSVSDCPRLPAVYPSVTVPVYRQHIRLYECPRLPSVYSSVCPSAGSVFVSFPVCRQCIRRCLFSELASLGPGCRLPWMPVELMPVEVPVCSTAEDYQTLLNYTRMFSRTYIAWTQSREELQANNYYVALKG